MRDIQFSSFSVGRNMIVVMLVLAVSSKASHRIIEDPYTVQCRECLIKASSHHWYGRTTFVSQLLDGFD